MGILTLTIAAALFVAPGPAGAQEIAPDPYVAPATSVAPETTVLNPESPQAAEASAGTQAQVKSSTLAFSGGDAMGLLLTGAVLLAAGLLVMRMRRRPSGVEPG